MLAKGRTYGAAVKSFEPYDRTREACEDARAGLVAIAERARLWKKHADLFTNKRLEGNAPNTIKAVIGILDA